MFFLIAETFTLLIFAIAFGAILGWWLRYALSPESDVETSAAAPSTAEAAEADSDQSNELAECEAETTELKAQLEALKVELDKSQQQCRRCQQDLAEKDAELIAATAPNDSSNEINKDSSTEATPKSLLSQPSDKQGAAPVKATPEKTKTTADTKSEDASDSEPAALFSVDLAAKPADNLQKISGVGPKLSGLLNELGVYHFTQIANFNDDDIARVNKRLSFTGRIEREKWVEQAKVLAEGGETDFSINKCKSKAI